MKASATALFWRAPSEIVFARARRRRRGVARARPARPAALETLWTGARGDRRASASRATAAASAAVLDSFSEPPEVCGGPDRRVEAGHAASTRGPRRSGARRRALHWKSDGATRPGLAPRLRRTSTRRGSATRWSSSSHGGPSGAAHAVAGPRAGRRASRRRATSSSCPTRAAATARARRSRRATSRTSAAATCATSSRGVDAVAAGRARRPEAPRDHAAGATAATWRCGP